MALRRLTYFIAAAFLAFLVTDVLAWAVVGRGDLPTVTVADWPEWEYVTPGDSLIVYPGIVLDGDSITVHGLSEEGVGRVFDGVRSSADSQVGVRFARAAYRVGSGTALSPEGVHWNLTVLPFDSWPLVRDVSVSLFKPMDLDESLGISYGHRERYVYVFGWRRVWTSGLSMA